MNERSAPAGAPAGNGMLVCVSHSPIIMIRSRPPAQEEDMLDLYARCREEIRRFSPELVVVFGTDHYAGFHLNMMPPYCLGLAAEAVDDVGGFGGRLDVPAEVARDVAETLYDEGFDSAVSHRMTVDHGFSQPLHRLLGALDALPTLPVFVNAMAPPLPRFGRTRRLGEVLGRGLGRLGKRILFIGSGGLSHHPTRYYPAVGEAAPEVAAWQMEAERGGTWSRDEWFDRLRAMHVEGADMLADGRRTREDIRLNPGFDEAFMDMTRRLDFAETDRWQAGPTIRQAGIGAMELQTWVAAAQAYKEMDGRAPHASLYVPALEYGVGYGMAVAGGAR